MPVNLNSRKFRVSRFKQLIFPQELIIDNVRVMTRKRKFPLFWIVKEESIPLRSVASIQVIRGLLFASMIIENSGGPFPIVIQGMTKKHAYTIREIIENHKPVPTHEAIDQTVPDIRVLQRSQRKGNSILGNILGIFRKSGTGRQRTDDSRHVIEKWNHSLDGKDFDPIVIRDEANTHAPESRPGLHLSENLKSKVHHKPVTMKDPLPTIEEVVYDKSTPDDEEKEKEWMKGLVEAPRKK
jgi:hypothetical protein